MSKKAIAALGATAVAAALLSGCAAGGTNDGDPANSEDVTLTFLVFETPNLSAEYWDDVIEKTNAVVQGVTIEKIVAPSAEGRNEYARQLDSTGELPDVMVAIEPTGLAEAGKLAEFSEEELSDWTSPLSNSFDGKIYQLPTNSQSWQIYYNKAAFATAGIDAPPTTWDELIADAAALQDAGIEPLLVGGGPDTVGPRWLFEPIVANEVYGPNPNWLGDLMDGKTDFSDPLFVTALERMVELAPYASQAGLSQGYADAQASFLAGEAAMYPMGSWFAAAPDETQQEEIGLFDIPSADTPYAVATYTGGGLSVSSSAPDVDKAKEWAKEFSKQNADGGARYDGLFIALEGYEPPADLPKLYHETFALFKDAVETGAATPSFGYEGGIPALPAGFISEVDAVLLDLLAKRTTVSEAVDYLNEKFVEIQK